MATVPTSQDSAAPSWNGFRVTVFGGQHDSHIDTGEDYRTITLASIFDRKPQAKSKMAGDAFLASSYHNFGARSHEAQRQHGEFVALVADIDKGDLDLSAIRSAAQAFADGSAWLVYSSAHSRDGDQRWRMVFPLSEPCRFEQWFDAQSALFTFLESSGIPVDHALSRAGQPIYLPNVPEAHRDGTPLRDGAGEPIYYQTDHSGVDAAGVDLRRGIVAGGIAAIRQKRAADDREREVLKAEAARRFAEKPRPDSANIITTFNASTDIATMLTLCDYKQSPRNTDDWRSPQQSGETYATRVIDGKWISLSESDASSGLGHKCRTGCFGDAYDLYVHYKHKGDHKEAYRALGREFRPSNVVQGNFRGDDQDPGYQEMPEWVATGDVEPDYEVEPVSPAAQEGGDLLPFEWFDAIDAQLEANWLVEDLIPSAGLCLVYGHPGCGKSFFALDMAMHVSQGAPWRDRDVTQGLVVYIGAEGQRGLRQRVAAFRQHHGITQLPFALIPVEVNLLANDGDLGKVLDTIHELTKRFDLPVGMIVIDTLARTFGGGDEIGSDMVAYVNNVGRIQHAYNCTTMVIHHRPKDSANETPRGHGSLWGACDTIILVEDKGAGIKQCKVTKQKDAEPAEPITFELKVVELGEDEKGRPVTSCVVVPSDSQIMPDKRADTLSDGQKIAFEQLCQTMSATGFRANDTVPIGVLPHGLDTRICRVSDWQDRTISALCCPGKTADTLARTFRRYRERLQSLGFVGIYEDFVWRIK